MTGPLLPQRKEWDTECARAAGQEAAVPVPMRKEGLEMLEDGREDHSKSTWDWICQDQSPDEGGLRNGNVHE